MRPCQLCGAASWGPISQTQELRKTLTDFAALMTADPQQYLRCDQCKSIALRAQIDEPKNQEPESPLQHFQHALVAQLSGTSEITRTERLIGMMVRGAAGQDKFTVARDLVAYARELEDELDTLGSSKQYTAQFVYGEHVHVFHDRSSLERWLLHGLMTARNAVLDEELPPDLLGRIAFHLLEWMVQGALIS